MRILLSALLINPIWQWVHRLGGPGLILLGLADNSVVPLPGSMDVFVVLLSARNPEWWPYYGVMATLGAVFGGYLTYRIAEKGGKETLEKKVGARRAAKVYKRFEEHGFVTVFIGSILPPPFPMVPVLMTAGVLQYPPRKFLSALAAGRGLRYFALAFLGRSYGGAIIGFLSRYYMPLLYTLLALAVMSGIGALLYFRWYRPKYREQNQVDDRLPRRETRRTA